MKLTKTQRNNLERLIWGLVAMTMIFVGAIIKNLIILTVIGAFLIGIILGQLK